MVPSGVPSGKAGATVFVRSGFGTAPPTRIGRSLVCPWVSAALDAQAEISAIESRAMNVGRVRGVSIGANLHQSG